MARPFFIGEFKAEELEQAMIELGEPIARAGTLMLQEISVGLKKEGRENIATAGFSKKWQNALRVDAHPNKSGVYSMRAALQMYHQIHYADLFELGGSVFGKPILWVPLSNALPFSRTRKEARPRHFVSQGVRLFSINRPGKAPLLAAKVRSAKERPSSVTMAQLVAGSRAGGKRTRRSQPLRTVPLFFGIDTVNIRKRFNLVSIFNKWADRAPDIYQKKLGEEF